ncbi:butyrophilin-like protein 9 [Sarcophilus harrisii]|uniref:Butyrophilin subfamily 1 member A1 n=2 Tax=Sarcophilus harrisii TaxID=9305 RepID=A0A7N4P6X1_SARHA|nr:butyrophilin-like protein 9 [Sarcophilus harrisii]
MQCLFLQDLSFVLLVLLPWTVAGKFTVIGPQQPVIAMVGEEAIFPCHLSPQMDAQDMDVTWFYGESLELVHQYKERQDYLNHQRQEYKGRTEFLRDDISTGSVALKLHHIRPSDEGKYWCLFESSKTYGEAEYQVYVAGKGSAPHIYAVNDENKRHRLVCTSTGWYPEPEVLWRKNQETLLPQDTTIKKEENGLFSVETSITVSMNSIVNVSCFIGNPLLRQKLEASFSLSDDLSQNNPPGIVIWIVTGVLVIAVILILIFVIWKLKKGKGVNKEDPVSYASVKVENEFGVNNDEDDVFRDEPDLQTAQKYRVDVTFDADTARPFLLPGMDGKSSHSSSHQNKHRGPQGLEPLYCVLGKERFTSGKYYWEVQIEDKMKWILGLCNDSVMRKGRCEIIPATEFWTISLKKGNQYWAKSRPPTRLHLRVPPKVVGIFLDYEAGCISFYNVTDDTHIYTFQDTFREALRLFMYSDPLFP